MTFSPEQMAFVDDHATMLLNPEASFVIDESAHETANLMPGLVDVNIDVMEGLGMVFKLLRNLEQADLEDADLYDVHKSLKSCAMGVSVSIALLEGAVDPVVEHAAESINAAAAVMGWSDERADLVQRSLALFTPRELNEDMPAVLEAAIRRKHKEMNTPIPHTFWGHVNDLLEGDNDDDNSE